VVLGEAVSESPHSHIVLDAVNKVTDPANKQGIHACVGSALRSHPDWKKLASQFGVFTSQESAQGPELERRLASIRAEGAQSQDWLAACLGLKGWAKTLRKGRTDQLEQEMVRAISRIDSGLQDNSESPATELSELRTALAAEEEALTKLSALEEAIGQGDVVLSAVRRSIENRMGKASQGMLCAAGVDALVTAGADASLESMVAACDSLRQAKSMGNALTETMQETLEAASATLQEKTLKLSCDNAASFKLGYRMLEAQELAYGLAAEAYDTTPDGLALIQAQRLAMQLWEALNGVELVHPLSPGRETAAKQKTAMARLVVTFAEWQKLANSWFPATPESPDAIDGPSNDPAEALPAAKAAQVFARSSAAVLAYHGRNVQESLDILQSAIEELESVCQGGSNGSSWKAGLSNTAAFEDVAHASQILLRNAPNLSKPLTGVKEARTRLPLSKLVSQSSGHRPAHSTQASSMQRKQIEPIACPTCDRRHSSPTRERARTAPQKGVQQ
jgi:hypothetical protein